MDDEAREVMKRHPGVGALTLGRIPIGPNTVQWIEWFIGFLRGAGAPDRVATYAGDLGTSTSEPTLSRTQWGSTPNRRGPPP
jgi:hypothetical protein